MKKLFFLLLPMLAAACAGLHSCKKCHAEGRVLEFGTDKPIANATVSLTECEGEVLGSLNCFTTATATTNANGEVAFDKTGFALAAEATGYWPTGDDFVQFTSECPDPVTVRLFPEAWLEVTIRNESGAYEFYPPSSSSTTPGIKLGQGEKLVLGQKLVFGNTNHRYVFGVFDSPNHVLTDISNVKVKTESGESLLIVAGFAGVSFDAYCQGHQTTKITIIY